MRVISLLYPARICKVTATSSQPSAAGYDLQHERRFSLGVCLALARKPPREILLERGVFVAQHGIRAKGIAENEVIQPERAFAFGQVQVVRAGISASEVLASRDALLTAMDVTGRDECFYIRENRNVEPGSASVLVASG